MMTTLRASLPSASLVLDQADDLERVEKLYTSWYRYANRYPFPGYQMRHPLLRHFSGILPLHPRIPDWWQEIVEVAPDMLTDVLAQLSGKEILDGRLSDEHAKLLKEIGRRSKSLSGSTPAWAQSPRLGRLLSHILPGGQSHRLYQEFLNRGSAIPLSILVSSHPWDILTLGSSAHFISCQHLQMGSQTHRLPSNLLDSGMCLAYVADPSANRWQLERIYTRAILRLLRDEQGRFGILIDRFYGDFGHRRSMQQSLFALIRSCGLSVWQPLSYKEQGNSRSFDGTPFQVQGIPQAFGDFPIPYFDQEGEHLSWRRVDSPMERMWRIEGQVVEVTAF